MSKPRQPRYGDIYAGHDEGAQMAELARLLWAMYREELEARGLFNAARAQTLDRLVRATVEYETYYPIALAEGPVRLADSGNQYVNMLWSQVKALADMIAKLEKSLTLTPESVGDKTVAKTDRATSSGAEKYLARAATH